MSSKRFFVLLLLIDASIAQCQVFTSSFETGDEWTVLGTDSASSTFGYDYSINGIPPAPNSADTVGLKLTANTQVPLEYSEIAVVPNSFVAPANYVLQVDMWGVFDFEPGSAEFLGAFAGHDGTTLGRDGLGLLFTSNGGASRDFRLYKDDREQFVADGPYNPSICDGASSANDCRNNLDDFWRQYFGSAPAGGQWITLELEVRSSLDEVRVSLTHKSQSSPLMVGVFDMGGTIPSGQPAVVYADLFADLGNAVESFGIFDNFHVTATTGDFNMDGMWDCTDIDDLDAAIASGSTDLSFDMNGDGLITLADITDMGNGWLAVGGAKNPNDTGGNPFLVGDATLDGIVDGLDFIEWNRNKFTTLAAWCGGDFNADGIVDGLDFIEWNANKFTSSNPTPASVPEPSNVLLPGILAATWFLHGNSGVVRRKRTS